MSCEYSVTVTATAPLDDLTAVLTVTGPVILTAIVGNVVTELTSTTGTEGLLYFTASGGTPSTLASSPSFGEPISGGADGYTSAAVGQRFSAAASTASGGSWTDGPIDFEGGAYLPSGQISAQFPAEGGVSPSGAMEWTIWYRPLAPGASIVAV